MAVYLRQSHSVKWHPSTSLKAVTSAKDLSLCYARPSSSNSNSMHRPFIPFGKSTKLFPLLSESIILFYFIICNLFFTFFGTTVDRRDIFFFQSCLGRWKRIVRVSKYLNGSKYPCLFVSVFFLLLTCLRKRLVLIRKRAEFPSALLAHHLFTISLKISSQPILFFIFFTFSPPSTS